jgi:hypothetical protein
MIHPHDTLIITCSEPARAYICAALYTQLAQQRRSTCKLAIDLDLGLKSIELELELG